MQLASLDTLFAIAEQAPLLERCEAALQSIGKKDAADKLNKLQQDVGVAIDIEMCGGCADDIAPGPQTAALKSRFEPVTESRVNRELMAVRDCIQSTELKTEYAAFLANTGIGVAVAPLPISEKTFVPKV